MADLSLLVRRLIDAPPAQVFAAWTEPRQLVRWWGPEGVSCPEAQVDLRVGGRYAIANRTPSGMVWIRGEFLVVEPPHRLVYTWRVEGMPGPPQRVQVRFVERAGRTEVVVLHERIGDPEVREEHAVGWQGCLSGLKGLFS